MGSKVRATEESRRTQHIVTLTVERKQLLGRIQELEAQCAAMREALIMIAHGLPSSGESFRDFVDRVSRAALSTDAGKAMSERLEKAEADYEAANADLGDARQALAKAERELASAQMECQRHQVGDTYNLGHEHGAQAALEKAAKAAESLYARGNQKDWTRDHADIAHEVAGNQIAAAIRALKTGGGT